MEFLGIFTAAAVSLMLAGLVRIWSQTNDLHEWHAKEDAEGVKVWYVRPSLQEAIVKMADAVEQIGRLEERQAERTERQTEQMEQMAAAITELAAAVQKLAEKDN